MIFRRGIRELAEKAQKEGAYDLSQGVIALPPPQAIFKSLEKVNQLQASTYNNKRGVLAFREAIRDLLEQRNFRVKLENVIGTSGVTGALAAALLSHCSKGARVILPEPFFIGHRLMLELLGYEIDFLTVPLETAPDWGGMIERMKKAEAFILTSPANPTGQVVPPDILLRLSKEAKKSNCLLLVDEMYREFIWDEDKADDEDYQELDLTHTVITRSFSKTWAIPGWRAGFTITDVERAEAMAAAHDALYLGGSTLAQHTLALALREFGHELEQYVQNIREVLLRNRNRLAKAFSNYGMEPLISPAAYYMLIRHRRDNDSAAFQELLEKKIVTVPVHILFSQPRQEANYIRIHFAVKEETAEAVAKILQG
jgi:aspartate/methionine/tyrosine aminotransferase